MNNNKFKFELAVLDDIPQINDIIISFWGKKAVYTNQFYYHVLKCNLSYVYKLDRELVAVCLVECSQKDNVIFIDLLCVKKNYQGNGLGKALMDFCIKNCVKEGYTKFFLHVAITNKVAFNLYKKLGFSIDKTINNYYSSDKPPDNDAYLMKMEIKQKENNIKNNWLRYYNNNNEVNSKDTTTNTNNNASNNNSGCIRNRPYNRYHFRQNNQYNNHSYYESSYNAMYNNGALNYDYQNPYYNFNYTNYGGYSNYIDDYKRHSQYYRH